MPPHQVPLIVYVDVDETLIRNYGKSRIPIPNVIKHVRALFQQGAVLYCWSSGGALYARQIAEECSLADCFQAFLPKPQVVLDDQHISTWRRLLQIHPNSCDQYTLKDYYELLRPQDHTE